MKTDNQFESVPEEIEAENREESDLENSIRSPAYHDNQQSNDCTDKSVEDDVNSSQQDEGQRKRSNSNRLGSRSTDGKMKV